MHRVPFVLPLLFPRLLWRVPTAQKEVYLTFDDGPTPGPTDFVLNCLQSHEISATFFVLGKNVEQHPRLFDQVLRAGHTAGNHTFDHRNGWKTTRAEYLANTERCHDILAHHNVPPQHFRPPYGRILPGQVRALSGYTIVMWDVLTRDYRRELSSERCLRGSLSALRPGSIVVLHDSLKAEKNMTYVLPRLIDYGKTNGWKFLPLPGSNAR